jgi:MFS family permease
MAFVMAARRGAKPRQMTAIMVCSMLSGAMGPVFTGPLLDHPGRRTMSTLMLVLFGVMLSLLWVDVARRPRY